MLRGSLDLAATWFRITIYCTKHSKKQTFKFMIFESNKYIQLNLFPSIKRISTMYLYSHIVELSLVGNSQVPIIIFLLI